MVQRAGPGQTGAAIEAGGEGGAPQIAGGTPPVTGGGNPIDCSVPQ